MTGTQRATSFVSGPQGSLPAMRGQLGAVEIHPEFLARLRRPPSESSVPGSLPVLFFGDLPTAKAASVGLNPSKQEYLDPQGQELTGSNRRFETLGSLNSRDRASLTEEQCDRAVETMRAYFCPGKPIYGWFRPLARVMESMGYSYPEGEAAHLDLVQEATDPTWSRMNAERPGEAKALLKADLPFLAWQIEAFPLQVIVCNGRTVFDTVSRLLGAELRATRALARITWYASWARAGGREIGVLGWNLPLVRATGLGAEGERELGRLLASQLEREAPSSPRHPKAAGAGRDSLQRVRVPRRTEWDDRVTRDHLLRLVRTRRRKVRRFLNWASGMEANGESLRWDARHDIEVAREAARLFGEPWWGVVVFSCFGSLRAADAVSGRFSRSVRADQARRLLEEITFPRGSVGHHRTRPGLTGAKAALVAACERAADFEEILLHGDGFHGRYEELRELRAAQWGRTTCFDLVLRTGALGIGEARYAPDRAYLDDSTGPKTGFERVWGIAVTRHNADWCERVLAQWTDNWSDVAEEVGVEWPGAPYVPGDFENALCVFQKHVRRGFC